MKVATKRSSAYGISRQMLAVLRLRELLLSGEYPPGQRLAEIPLAKRLKVSRTPLRLALMSLEQEGLVEEYPTGGYVVRSFRLSDIYDSIEIRGMLEGLAARLIVERGLVSPSGLKELREHLAEIDLGLEQMRKAPEDALNMYIRHNELFHGLLLSLADSPILSREMERVVRLPFAAPSTGFVRAQIALKQSQQILRLGQDQHRAIVEALENREGTRVEMLMREHSRIARQNLEIALANGIFEKIHGLHLIRLDDDRDRGKA